MALWALSALDESGGLPSDWDYANLDALEIGAQGPDPLLGYRVPFLAGDRKLAKLGSRMHSERIDDFLLALLRHCGKGGAVAKAYAMGFLCHYGADTIIHPYIFALSMHKGKYHGLSHVALESAMDLWLYREEGGRGAPHLMQAVFRMRPLSLLSEVFSKASCEVFPDQPITSAQASRAMLNFYQMFRLLYLALGAKCWFYFVLEKVLGQKEFIISHTTPRKITMEMFLNEKKSPWFSPWFTGVMRNDSVDSLLDKATIRCTEIMRAAVLFWDSALSEREMRQLLGDLHYNSARRWSETWEL